MKMSEWRLHWLEAEGDLEPLRQPITHACDSAHQSISTLMAPPRLDILIQRLAGQVIPELGLLGQAHRSSLFSLTIDPDNVHFANALDDGSLKRQVMHEVHHCMRMAGPGYGHTLGEALVSEGLAGQFVRLLLGTEAEPWERAVPLETLRNTALDAATLASNHYDHSAWFFGTGQYPRWFGYTLGYEIVGHWLAEMGEVDEHTWVNVPAATVLAVASKAGILSQDPLVR
ncbi:DUF2268 domain-containing putative Zn-dependent protease [Pseudomonas fluorescens]|uniref:DUF2268 domain-containing protein n=1 Tax=Pseudomonas fluorescens TaxID=294 RepID=A0A5E7F2N0_PSEFL|nr:DUF2268 domain-containing putative Zn-dependent protease [Pseudomonas fluorescens]VVO31923.1 hypothetical protein PS723_05062 [Pseudomonas fluorescens]